MTSRIHIMCRVLTIVLAAVCWERVLPDDAMPAGMWVTVDDKTAKPTAVVEIALRDSELIGTVRQIFPQPGQEPEPRCDKCEDGRKDQPVKGMQILWGMKKTNDGYGGGHILDPDNGVTYRCRVKLSEDGRHLQVHGYVGIPLFGRTQVWTRQTGEAPAATAPQR